MTTTEEVLNALIEEISESNLSEKSKKEFIGFVNDSRVEITTKVVELYYEDWYN